jgi:cytochrome c5
MKATRIIFVSLIFMVSPLQLVQADDSADSKSLFEGRCQMCHQLPEPGMLTPKQWKLILATMQQRMQQAGVPPLTQRETELILEYIAEQSQ